MNYYFPKNSIEISFALETTLSLLILLEKIVLSKLSKKLFFSYFTDIFFPTISEALLKKGKNNKG